MAQATLYALSMAALPPELRQDLQRQLRMLTPWHVRVTVRSNARRTSVQIWSLLWIGHGSCTTKPPVASLARQIANIVLFVQSFMAGEGGVLWPGDREPATTGEALIPDVQMAEASVTVVWTRGGRSVFALAPLPLGRHS